MTVEIKDNKGNICNIGLINNTMQNNIDLTSENKIEIRTSIVEFAKALIGNATYKFIGNYKLKKEIFEKELSNELKKIDTEKIVEPRMSVVGPTIESLKYTLDEEQIRKMYIKLLAKELNEDTHSKVLPAYIEIIKQLSKEDARFLGRLNNLKKKQISLFSLRANTINKNYDGYKDLGISIIVERKNECLHTIEPKSIVLDNLKRLNIIKIDHTSSIPNDDELIKSAFNSVKNKYKVNEDEYVLDYETGILEITDFGESFIDICCS